VGTLTTSGLISEVSYHLAEREDVTDDRIVQALNLAQEYMARSEDFDELRVVETGTLTITGTPATDKFLAFSTFTYSNPLEIYSFRVITSDGRSKKLSYRTARTFDRLIPEPEFYATGVPDIYTAWANKLELWRIPDDAWSYDIRLSKFATALSASTPNAASDFKEKDDLLIFLAVSWIFGQLGEYERMGAFFSMYRARMESAEMKQSRHPDLDIVSDGGRAADVNVGRPWADPFVRFVR
jgi:hypothetical protein